MKFLEIFENKLRYKQIKIDIMKTKENKLQQFIKNIKTFFINKLCVSLRRDTNTTKKGLSEKDKCGKFEKFSSRNFNYKLFFLDMVGNIIKFLKISTKTASIVAFSFGILLFAPKNVILYLQLNKFIEKNGEYIGICFVFSVGIILMWVIQTISKYIKTYWYKKEIKKQTIENLKHLSKEEKNILREFLIQGKEIICVLYDDANVMSLLRKNVLKISSSGLNTIYGQIAYVCISNVVKYKITNHLLELPDNYKTNNAILNERPSFVNTINVLNDVLTF